MGSGSATGDNVGSNALGAQSGHDGTNAFDLDTDLPGSFSEFVESVIPHLQRKGLFRRAYEGSTLREHLGLAELKD